jgi:predicted histidine transporter YuiF (NhaC family)
MAGFIDVHDVGQIGTIFGIMTILVTTFFQLRSYKKEQKIEQERNREAITREINDKTAVLFERIEGRLEAIKIAALITTEDIAELKVQLAALQLYVQELDKTGTVEWQKTKPFIMEKIGILQKSIDELEERIASFEIRRKSIVNDIERHKSNT